MVVRTHGKNMGVSKFEEVLIAEPGPVMFVSGVTSPSGEQCVVTNEDDSVSVVSCLSGIANGDGREIFSLDDDGQIKSVASDNCITLADGDTYVLDNIVTMFEICCTSESCVGPAAGNSF